MNKFLACVIAALLTLAAVLIPATAATATPATNYDEHDTYYYITQEPKSVEVQRTTRDIHVNGSPAASDSGQDTAKISQLLLEEAETLLAIAK